MPVTLISTPGAPDANSYPSLVEIKDYGAANLYAAEMNALSDAQLSSLAIMCTRLVDADKWPWTGSAATDTQALGWPRNGMAYRTGFPIPNTVIPRDLKDAICEFIRQMAVSDRQGDNDAVRLGLTSLKAGSVALGFDPKIMPKEEASWIIMPDSARMLLVPSWKQLTYEEQILANKAANPIFRNL